MFKGIVKKVISLLLVVIIVSCNLAYANDLEDFLATFDDKTDEEKIELYKSIMETQAKHSEFDFVGRKGDKILFTMMEHYADGDILKEIEFDFKTFNSQLKLAYKAYKDNQVLYDGLLLTSAFAKALDLLGVKAKVGKKILSELIKKL